MNVCQRNVALFDQVECMFDKVNDTFSGFWKLDVIATSERWTRTFSLVQSKQLSGKLSRLKNKHVRKNVHASRLNANGTCSNDLPLIKAQTEIHIKILINISLFDRS